MYDLHSLGWHSFQQLCLTVCREVMGQTVESFLCTADAGRDGAFSGTWKRQNNETLSGRFVIQCKFTSKREKNLRVTDIADEAKKAKKLAERGLCDSYVLMTNAGVSGPVAEEIERLLKANAVKHIAIFGSTWMNEQIQAQKRLRMMVPRVYGLGDLSQILDDRAYRQAKALLACLRDDLSKIVITSAYRRAAEALDRHGFVLLIGEPAAGKTTIASMLAVAAIDQWGCSTLKLDDPTQIINHWNTDEPAQFFWVDDAFGVTQCESYLVYRWNHSLLEAKAMLNQRCKIVMTSRDYIYRRARNDLKEGAFPLFRESKVVIDVRDLMPDERQQILYNHIRLGRQERKFRTEIKPHLDFVAQHARFIPETARRLGDPLFTRGLRVHRSDIEAFVEKQEQLLEEIITGLDDHSKAALALIYMRRGALESPITLQRSERDAIERLGSDLGQCTAALSCLKGSLVQHSQVEEIGTWRFKHPTVGDAFASLLVNNPEWLGIYLQGSSVEELLSQITCGNVGLERAVAVPKNLFPIVRRRLAAFVAEKDPPQKSSDRRSQVDRFLTHRCSKEFLSHYANDPHILGRVVDPGLYLSACTEVHLAVRLHKLGLLPEKHRSAFVEKVIEYALNGDDMYAIENEEVRSVFTSAEMLVFRQRIRDELIPSLSEVTWHWQHDLCSPNQTSEEIVEPLLASYESLKKEFRDEPAILAAVEREIGSLNQWIAEEMAEHNPPRERAVRVFGDVDATLNVPHETRSIFDDVDQ